jgi:glycosyltransferase involved in cell wall biosynthesis
VEGEHLHSDPASGLRVTLESDLPPSLPVASKTTVFCFGHCFHVREPVADLQLLAGETVCRPEAARMPRRDLFEWLHRIGQDPNGHSYRSGFWATVPICAPHAPGVVELQARMRMATGDELRHPLGQIPIVEREPPASRGTRLPHGTIAICMAAFNPAPALLRAQIESLREQTYDRWICLISDGGSAPERFAHLLDVIAGDSRFVVSRSDRRLAPYRNFERALAMVPEDASLVALSDQDDLWYPDKLATLREALGSRPLVYSDQRLVTEEGRVLRDSLWLGRRNDHANLASLLIANTVPGASMLFRRELLELALPFPDAPGDQYHDHWLALVALASGEVAYVERPLYDYVQHTGAVSGDLVATAARHRPRVSVAPTGSRGWRSAYFGGYLGRAILAQTLLLRCRATLSPRKRRALRWFLASARSPTAFTWLALRPLRRLIGRDETLGGEVALVEGIAWRWLLAIAVGGAQLPGRRPFDASFPDPPRFEQRRLRRWRAAS